MLHVGSPIGGGGCDSSYMWEVAVTGTTRCSASRSLLCRDRCRTAGIYLLLKVLKELD